ncbi:MAG: hypothetical protein ABI905_03115 [Betaproteobacteria bacterium]
MSQLAEPVSTRHYWGGFSPLYDAMETLMEFRLTYSGLMMGNGNGDHKHGIRRKFHQQLKRLWQIYPHLKSRHDAIYRELYGERPFAQVLGENFSRNGFNFVPLVNNFHAPSGILPVVSVDVLFLRSGRPGHIFKSADIDARLKTLFDALQMPQSGQEIGNNAPAEDEKPFYVLLQDDRYIGNVSVNTDTLLQPTYEAGVAGHDNTHDTRLIIAVKIQSYDHGVFLP